MSPEILPPTEEIVTQQFIDATKDLCRSLDQDQAARLYRAMATYFFTEESVRQLKSLPF